MRFGLGRLRLPPDHFWSMTPHELASAAHDFNPLGTPSLSVDSLREMMRQFPDNATPEVMR